MQILQAEREEREGYKMKYYVYGKRSKVYACITNNHEEACERLAKAKKSYPDEEWVLIEE